MKGNVYSSAQHQVREHVHHHDDIHSDIQLGHNSDKEPKQGKHETQTRTTNKGGPERRALPPQGTKHQKAFRYIPPSRTNTSAVRTCTAKRVATCRQTKDPKQNHPKHYHPKATTPTCPPVCALRVAGVPGVYYMCSGQLIEPADHGGIPQPSCFSATPQWYDGKT